MKKQGAIVLGVGGDNSHGGVGTFFEARVCCVPARRDRYAPSRCVRERRDP